MFFKIMFVIVENHNKRIYMYVHEQKRAQKLYFYPAVRYIHHNQMFITMNFFAFILELIFSKHL